MTNSGGVVSSDEELSMEVIREALSDHLLQFPSYGSHFTLKRWLEEYDSNTDVIINKLRRTLTTLSALGAPKVDASSIMSANDAISKTTNTAEYFPGGFMGYDKDGNVLFMQPFGRLHSEQSMRTTRISDFFRLLLLEGHASHELVCAQEKKFGCRKGQVSVLDFDGFGRHVLYVPGLPMLSTAYGLLQLAFPGISRKIYIINAPSALAYAFGAIRMVLSKTTMDTIEFLGTNWQERLTMELGAKNILPFWGGNMSCDRPTGGIRMAGPLAESIKLNAAGQWQSRNTLSVLKIAARKSSVVAVHNFSCPTKLMWYFECDGGDIDFCIRIHNHEVFPRFRLNTSCFPEFGELICMESGTYEVCFNNKHTRLWNKTIFYRVELKEIESSTNG